MTQIRISMLFIFSILIISGSYTPIVAIGDNTVIPVDTGEPPIIDGNITNIEWNTSAVFHATLHQQETSIHVTTNTTHLFIGFNVTMDTFNPVNDTVPAYNNSIEIYDLGYNNQTHDWFALVFDNNLDKVSGIDFIGTKDSPDDVVVFDQYNSTAYDGYADGNKTQPFSPDVSTLYNGTVDPADTAGIGGEIFNLNITGTLLAGGNGTNDVETARNSSLIVTPDPEDIEQTSVVYEMVKPLHGTDAEGFDYSLTETGILQFKLFAWKDVKSNVSLKLAQESDWLTLRINETGSGIATKTVAETKLNLINEWVDSEDYDALSTVLSLYGFDLNTQTINEETNLNSGDLNIIILGSNNEISDGVLSNIIEFIRTGGTAMIFLSPEVVSASRTITDAFELSYLENEVLVPENEENATNELTISQFTSAISAIKSDALVTNLPVNEISIKSNAFNISSLLDESNKFVQGQEYMMYDLFTAPTDAVYDQTEDGYINDTESFNQLSLGIALDLLKGGRLALFPTDTLLSDKDLVNKDNFPFILRVLPWLAKTVQTLEVHDINVNKKDLKQFESLSVEVNATDSFGNQLASDTVVEVEVKIAGRIIQTVQLTKGSESLYTAVIEMNRHGYIDLESTAQLTGYGFAEGDNLQVFVEPKKLSINDLTQLSVILLIVFLGSLTTAVIAYLKTADKATAWVENESNVD